MPDRSSNAASAVPRKNAVHSFAPRLTPKDFGAWDRPRDVQSEKRGWLQGLKAGTACRAVRRVQRRHETVPTKIVFSSGFTPQWPACWPQALGRLGEAAQLRFSHSNFCVSRSSSFSISPCLPIQKAG